MNSLLKLRYFIFLFVFDLSWSIEEPAPPIDPAHHPKQKKIHSKASSEKEDLVISIRVYWLGEKARTLDGIFTPKKSFISVKHNISGNIYALEIPWKEINRIRIKHWIGEPDESGRAYFFPDQYELISKDGKSFLVVSNIADLNRIDLRNKYGKTSVYSYFVDFWKEGRWVNSKVSKIGHLRTHPLKEVFREIEFIK